MKPAEMTKLTVVRAYILNLKNNVWRGVVGIEPTPKYYSQANGFAAREETISLLPERFLNQASKI